MAHFIRVFTRQTETPTIASLTKSLEADGFVFDTFPKADDPRFAETNWKTYHIAYDNRYASVMIDRSVTGEDDFKEDIEEFQTGLAEQEASENKGQVEALLQAAQQIIAVFIPDDMGEEGWDVVEALLEKLLDETDGTLQVDGEGFYDKEGELLYAME